MPSSCQIINLLKYTAIKLIIYNNKMRLPEERVNDFFNFYFPPYIPSQGQLRFKTFLALLDFDIRPYQSQSMTCPKPIKDYGYAKKYDLICKTIPYVASVKGQQIQIQLLLQYINTTYNYYLEFGQKGIWKVNPKDTHFQQFFFFYLHEIFLLDSKIKKKYNYFDRFLLNTLYTLNILKTCNKVVRGFSNFLQPSFSWGEMFLYLCLRNISQPVNNQQMVKSSKVKKVIKIFQSQEMRSSTTSAYNSKSSSYSDEDQQKLVSLNQIFLRPLGGNLTFPKVKIFKIMKICKVVQAKEEVQYIQWSEFLQQYFQIVQQNSEVCFEHIISNAVAKGTYLLGQKIFERNCPRKKEEFLQQAFSYVFQVLEMVFNPNVGVGEDKEKPILQTIGELRKDYNLMRQLSQYNITIGQKFIKKILRSAKLVQLYKTYSSAETD